MSQLSTTGVIVQQAHRLVLMRCRELVREGVAITRRPRTLTPRTALLELSRVARLWTPAMAEGDKSSGRRKTDPVDPRLLMVAEVAAETLRVLRKDPVLRTAEAPIVGLLDEVLERWTSAPADRQSGDIAKLQSGAEVLARTYFEDAAQCLTTLIREEPHRLFPLEAVCIATISELRTRGWSDAGLRAWFDGFSEEDAVAGLLRLLKLNQRRFRCYVPLTGWDKDRALLSKGQPMSLAASMGERMVPADFPAGPYLTLWFESHDEADAAERAFLRARRVLDAVALVEPGLADQWRAPIVGVESGSQIQAHRVGLWRGSIEALPAAAHTLVEHDSLSEACRYRVQAMQLRDPFTRLSMLWLGLERLVVGSAEFSEPLTALRQLVPKTMALHKVSTEVEALARALEKVELSEAGRSAIQQALGDATQPGRIDRVRLLAWLQTATNDDAKRLRGALINRDVGLTQWFERLRMHMSGPRADRITEFFDATRQRIEWQLLRLYRAHHRLGVNHWPLSWVHDLSLHAHHYLTAIILAVMADRQGRRQLPVDVLSHRAAQYELFLGLVERGQARALRPEVLFEPLSLVGSAGTGTAIPGSAKADAAEP